MYEKAEAHIYIRKPLLKTGKPTILTLLDIYIFLKPKLRFYPLFKKKQRLYHTREEEEEEVFDIIGRKCLYMK